MTLSTGLSEAGWSRLGEGERSRQQGHSDGIMLVESFGGIGGARRALELLGVTPAVHVCIEMDEAARRVSAAAFPGVQHFEDIRKVTRKELLGCAEKESHITDVIHWGGFPCQGLSGLNAGRTGMEDQRSQLVYEMNRIDSELAHAFPLAAVHSGAENVASMNKSDRQAITKIRYDCPPVMCCPGPLSWCRRKRLYWLTWPVDATADAQLKVEEDHARLTFKCQRMPASRWLPRGHRLLDSGAQFCTFVRALPKPRPGFRPAGLGKTSKSALKRWKEHGYRYPPYQYELKNLIYSMKEKKAVPLPSAAREVLLHFRPDHTYLAMKTQDRKNNPVAFEDLRCSLLGNSFQCGVVAYLTGQLLFQRGFLSRLPTASDLADPAVVPSQLAKPSSYSRSDPAASAQAWRERSLDGHLLLARMYMGLQSHRGNEVRQETSGHFHKRGLLQSIDGRLWKWRTLISCRWKTKDEHINTLEARAILLLLKWKCRSQLRMNKKYLHLVDNTSVLGAFVKGRSSSRRLKYVIRRAQAYTLAGNLLPLLGYVRSHRNPADHPSRRFPQRSNRGALKK